jgi:hypothetical protein
MWLCGLRRFVGIERLQAAMRGGRTIFRAGIDFQRISGYLRS